MKADAQLQQQAIAIWLALQMKFETLQVPQTTCRTFVVRPRDQDDPHDDAHPEGENSAKRQKTSEYEGHVTRESSGQVNEEKEVQGLRRYCCHFTSFLQLSSIIFNPYARYGVEHWKNPHAKIFYIKMQKELGKPNEVVYSNSKIIQPDYKNLNKNDIADIYLLIMNGKVHDYVETGLLWSLSVFIRSSVIWEECMTFNLE
ncbi:hypothetical protein Tco_0037086 [Tanacetum coccineum]